jgi:hypothetical protein
MRFLHRKRKPTWRVSIYEAKIINNRYEPGKFVAGYYGRFDPSMMDERIMPAVPKLLGRWFKLPFLITEHCLEPEIKSVSPGDRKAENSLLSPPTKTVISKNIMAIIHKYGEYQLIGNNEINLPGIAFEKQLGTVQY